MSSYSVDVLKLQEASANMTAANALHVESLAALKDLDIRSFGEHPAAQHFQVAVLGTLNMAASSAGTIIYATGGEALNIQFAAVGYEQVERAAESGFRD